MNPTVIQSGRAPIIATSFTVPFTASVPMFPPGNSSGFTTNESVEIAISPRGHLHDAGIAELREHGAAEVREEAVAARARHSASRPTHARAARGRCGVSGTAQVMPFASRCPTSGAIPFVTLVTVATSAGAIAPARNRP